MSHKSLGGNSSENIKYEEKNKYIQETVNQPFISELNNSKINVSSIKSNRLQRDETKEYESSEKSKFKKNFFKSLKNEKNNDETAIIKPTNKHSQKNKFISSYINPFKLNFNVPFKFQTGTSFFSKSKKGLQLQKNKKSDKSSYNDYTSYKKTNFYQEQMKYLKRYQKVSYKILEELVNTWKRNEVEFEIYHVEELISYFFQCLPVVFYMNDIFNSFREIWYSKDSEENLFFKKLEQEQYNSYPKEFYEAFTNFSKIYLESNINLFSGISGGNGKKRERSSDDENETQNKRKKSDSSIYNYVTNFIHECGKYIMKLCSRDLQENEPITDELNNNTKSILHIFSQYFPEAKTNKNFYIETIMKYINTQSTNEKKSQEDESKKILDKIIHCKQIMRDIMNDTTVENIKKALSNDKEAYENIIKYLDFEEDLIKMKNESDKFKEYIYDFIFSNQSEVNECIKNINKNRQLKSNLKKSMNIELKKNTHLTLNDINKIRDKYFNDKSFDVIFEKYLCFEETLLKIKEITKIKQSKINQSLIENLNAGNYGFIFDNTNILRECYESIIKDDFFSRNPVIPKIDQEIHISRQQIQTYRSYFVKQSDLHLLLKYICFEEAFIVINNIIKNYDIYCNKIIEKNFHGLNDLIFNSKSEFDNCIDSINSSLYIKNTYNIKLQKDIHLTNDEINEIKSVIDKINLEDNKMLLFLEEINNFSQTKQPDNTQSKNLEKQKFNKILQKIVDNISISFDEEIFIYAYIRNILKNDIDEIIDIKKTLERLKIQTDESSVNINAKSIMIQIFDLQYTDIYTEESTKMKDLSESLWNCLFVASFVNLFWKIGIIIIIILILVSIVCPPIGIQLVMKIFEIFKLTSIEEDHIHIFQKKNYLNSKFEQILFLGIKNSSRLILFLNVNSSWIDKKISPEFILIPINVLNYILSSYGSDFLIESNIGCLRQLLVQIQLVTGSSFFGGIFIDFVKYVPYIFSVIIIIIYILYKLICKGLLVFLFKYFMTTFNLSSSYNDEINKTNNIIKNSLIFFLLWNIFEVFYTFYNDNYFNNNSNLFNGNGLNDNLYLIIYIFLLLTPAFILYSSK